MRFSSTTTFANKDCLTRQVVGVGWGGLLLLSLELFVDKDGEWRGFKEPMKGRQAMKRNGKKKRKKRN